MHAALITAYKDFEQLAHLVSALSDARLHVHVDKKSLFTPDEFRWLASRRGVTVVQTYAVSWGGFSHVAAMIDGLAALSSDDRVETIHILSGQDFPIRPLAEYAETRDPRIAYVGYTKVTDQPYLLHRFQTTLEFPDQDYRDPAVRAADEASIKRRLASGEVRTGLGSYSPLYKGIIWSTLPRDMAAHVVHVAATDAAFMSDLRSTRIPEEFFLQTILMHGPFRDRVSGNNPHYVRWTPDGAGTSLPACLDEHDLETIIGSRKIFARKLESPRSAVLRQALSERLGLPPVDLRWRT